MSTKSPTLLMLSLIITAMFLAGCGRERLHLSMHEPSNDCSRIASLVPRLRSASNATREDAKKDILLISSGSESSRQCAVQKLLSIAAIPATRSDRGRLLFSNDQRFYTQWKEIVDLLGKMRATEAMDTLFDCLDCNDGQFSFIVDSYPTALSLIKFGKQATPKLQEMLQQKTGRNRHLAAELLAIIEDRKAKPILLETLKTEKDKVVIDTIKYLLSSSWNDRRVVD